MKKPESYGPSAGDVAELLVRSGGEGTITVRGESMVPTLSPGRAVRVRFGPHTPRFGALIVFRQADYLAVHRYLGPARAAGGPCLRTRGDGLPKLDPPLDPKDLVGSVVSIERPDGFRTAQGAGPRCYALALALHDLCWAALGALAEGWVLSAAVARADRWLVGAVDRIFFRVCHPRERVGER